MLSAVPPNAARPTSAAISSNQHIKHSLEAVVSLKSCWIRLRDCLLLMLQYIDSNNPRYPRHPLDSVRTSASLSRRSFSFGGVL